MDEPKTEVHPEESFAAKCREVFARWLKDGKTWIGVFRNEALDSEGCGRKVAFSYDESMWEQARIGTTTAPDHETYGLGWKYLLLKKCRTVEEAMQAMKED